LSQAAQVQHALRLPFVPPFDWPAMLAFLAARAIPGVEAVAGETYRRTARLGDAAGAIEVCRSAPIAADLIARVSVPGGTDLAPIAARLRHVFDLDADPARIAAHLGQHALLAPLVAARPGSRVPGAWEPFELAVRAILGQQVSVAGATTLAGRLVARFGARLPDGVSLPGLSRLFPRPADLACADLREIGLPRARAASISAFGAAVAADPELLHPGNALETLTGRLAGLPGIGPWTAHYIAMRAMREPDAFPASDLGLLRAATEPGGARVSPAVLLARAEAWRPWRAYAAMHLWASDAARTSAARSAA
jgi:AraC family transcriptional regulator of adaptative response / DNA-3-methyladenine glycosylase II